MMSNTEASRLMAKGLTYQATGEMKKSESNRQLVAINNFLWRADQLIWQREHVNAMKMLQKAMAVAGRMEQQPEDLMQELRIRKLLLEDREHICPMLRIGDQAVNDFHVEFFDSMNGPESDSSPPGSSKPWPPNRNFLDELEALVFARNEVFLSELECNPQLEDDERDEISRHCVLNLGNAIVGGARFWIQLPLTASSPGADSSPFPPIPVAILDRLFINNEYRGRGLAKKLLTTIKADATRRRLPLFILVRNEPNHQHGETINKRFRELVKSKLMSSKSFQMVSSNLFIPHRGVSGGLGAGITATVFEPCFTAM